MYGNTDTYIDVYGKYTTNDSKARTAHTRSRYAQTYWEKQPKSAEAHTVQVITFPRAYNRSCIYGPWFLCIFSNEFGLVIGPDELKQYYCDINIQGLPVPISPPILYNMIFSYMISYYFMLYDIIL